MEQEKKPTYTIRNTAKTLSSMARLLARAFNSISALKNTRANIIDYNYTATEFFSFYIALENGRVELADKSSIILKPFKHDDPATFPTESALYLALRYIEGEKRVLLPLITTWTGKEFLSSPNSYVIAYARFDKEESEAMLKAQGFIPDDGNPVSCSKNEFDPEKQFRIL